VNMTLRGLLVLMAAFRERLDAWRRHRAGRDLQRPVRFLPHDSICGHRFHVQPIKWLQELYIENVTSSGLSFSMERRQESCPGARSSRINRARRQSHRRQSRHHHQRRERRGRRFTLKKPSHDRGCDWDRRQDGRQ